jgi:hypothetical protein
MPLSRFALDGKSKSRTIGFMSTETYPARPLPGWLILVGSLAIVFHLLTIVVVVIASRSGPWPSPFGPSEQEPPAFVWQQNAGGRPLSDLAFGYLQPLHLANSYHFSSNRTDYSAVRFEVRLKYADGGEDKILQFPEEDANFWVRHRQSILAQNLGNDEPKQPPGPNTIPAPGEEVERVKVWEPGTGGREFHLRSKPVTSISQKQPLNGPSRWSQLLAKSYVRYLISKHGADSAELIRHSRDVIPPMVLISPAERWPQGLFSEMVADFTEREP